MRHLNGSDVHPIVSLRAWLAGLLVVAGAAPPAAQQMPDRGFRPMIEDRAYAIGTGPAACFDETHGNRYTLSDGFAPFAALVRRDGYVLRAIMALDRRSLTDCRILVMAAPRSPVEAPETRQWVGAGGRLLVIADHESLMAVSNLTAAFGIAFIDTPARPLTFRAADQTLRPHAIVRARHAKEAVASVMTFESHAMRVPATAESILVAADGSVHGAVMRVDMGRAAFFGDAALFTAQIAGPDRHRVGMNAPGAEQNFHFVLNVMHWLSGVI